MTEAKKSESGVATNSYVAFFFVCAVVISFLLGFALKVGEITQNGSILSENSMNNALSEKETAF